MLISQKEKNNGTHHPLYPQTTGEYRWPKGPTGMAWPRHGPPAIGPARPDRHFVPGRAGPWAAPPAQARPTSCRAVPCRPEGKGGPSGLFKISLFFPPLWAITYV